jgi:hypothetical protein
LQIGFPVGASLQTGFSVGHIVGASLQNGFSVGDSLQNGFSVGIVEQPMQTGLLGGCDEERGPERTIGGDAFFVG